MNTDTKYTGLNCLVLLGTINSILHRISLKHGFVLFFMLLVVGLSAQPTSFERRLDLNFAAEGRLLLQLEAGSFYVGGTQVIRGDYQRGFLLKMDTLGQLVSQRFYGALNKRQYFHAGVAHGNELWLAGTEEFQGNEQAALWKLNSNGDVLQQNFYGSSGIDGAFALCTMPAGGMALAGVSQDSSMTWWAATVWRTDSMGQVMWKGHLGGVEADACYAVLPTTDGGVLAAGTSASEARRLGLPGFGGLGFLWKLSATGQTEWIRYYGHQRFRASVNSLMVAGSGRLLLSGSTRELHPITGVELNKPFWLTVNATGDSLTHWVANMPGEGIFYSSVRHDNALWLAGIWQQEGQSSTNALLVKADTMGQPKTYTTFGDMNNELAYTIAQSQTNNLLLAGISSQPCDGCVYVVQTNRAGCHLPACMTAVGVNEHLGHEVKPHIYPNPTKQGMPIHIRFHTGMTDGMYVELVDLQGRTQGHWRLQEGNQTELVVTNGLNSGMYLLHVKGRQFATVSKFIVE
ncbi:MAG: hypothetical protein C0424_05240 [Sphingobacteriaceae bacterium]|nr:hypothetical protein [Sphingobacteriaceae bacterium]